MNKLCCLIILFTFAGETLAQITFQKTFGGVNGDYAYSVQLTNDGGYILVGNTESFGAGHPDVYLVKADSIGNIVWTKTFGEINNDDGRYINQTNDGGNIIVGYSSGAIAGNYELYLIKTNSNGDTTWVKTFGGTIYEFGASVQQTADGGYIIAGHTNSYSLNNDLDFYLVKTDTIGNVLWAKTFGGIDDDAAKSVQQTSDGGYIITGHTKSFGMGNFDIYLLKTDTNGSLQWSKTFGGSGSDLAFSVKEIANSEYIITGYTNSFGSGAFDVYLITVDSIGNLIWSKTYGGANNDFGYSIEQTSDGGYIVAGIANGGLNADLLLMKTDINGNLDWAKTYGGIGEEIGYSAYQTLDGGYIIAGYTLSFGAGNGDFYLIKTDSLGNSGCNEGNLTITVTNPATIETDTVTTVTSSATIVTNYSTIINSGGITITLCTTVGINSVLQDMPKVMLSPNPFTNKLIIGMSNTELSEIYLYDVFSRKILKQQFSNSATLNTEQLAKGIYLYEVRNKNGVIKKGKVVKD